MNQEVLTKLVAAFVETGYTKEQAETLIAAMFDKGAN
jgi:hypothetical protein